MAKLHFIILSDAKLHFISQTLFLGCLHGLCVQYEIYLTGRCKLMSHQPMSTDVVWFHVYFSLLYWSLIHHFFRDVKRNFVREGFFILAVELAEVRREPGMGLLWCLVDLKRLGKFFSSYLSVLSSHRTGKTHLKVMFSMSSFDNVILIFYCPLRSWCCCIKAFILMK